MIIYVHDYSHWAAMYISARRVAWGGLPAEGHVGRGAARRGAWRRGAARTALGRRRRRGARGGVRGGGGAGTQQDSIQSPKRIYKAPTDNTKPQQTIQRHKILDKT